LGTGDYQRKPDAKFECPKRREDVPDWLEQITRGKIAVVRQGRFAGEPDLLALHAARFNVKRYLDADHLSARAFVLEVLSGTRGPAARSEHTRQLPGLARLPPIKDPELLRQIRILVHKNSLLAAEGEIGPHRESTARAIFAGTLKNETTLSIEAIAALCWWAGHGNRPTDRSCVALERLIQRASIRLEEP